MSWQVQINYAYSMRSHSASVRSSTAMDRHAVTDPSGVDALVAQRFHRPMSHRPATQRLHATRCCWIDPQQKRPFEVLDIGPHGALHTPEGPPVVQNLRLPWDDRGPSGPWSGPVIPSFRFDTTGGVGI